MSVRNSVKLPLEQLAPYLCAMPVEGQRLELATLFGNADPVELEVGFGKGAFLVDVAPVQPKINFLGIEIDKGLQLYVANRLAKRQYANVRVMQGDAGQLLAQHLADDSLQAIHVYFPDPWWKKKHRRRRVFNETFAAEAARVIQPQGFLYLATDVAEYFQVMMVMMAERSEFVTLDVGREEAADDPAKPATNFEKKARNEGRPVWRARFQKR